MNVLLVYPNIADYPKDISFGLASISAVLKKFGHSVDLLDATFGLKEKDIARKIRTHCPKLVGITAATNDFHYAVQLANQIKKYYSGPIVCGGFHATIAPDDVIAEYCFDIVAIGEGEYSLLELANSIDRGKSDVTIKGFWFKQNGKIIKNDLRPLNKSIEDLPFPDRELFSLNTYIRHNRGVVSFISTRGCPYECSYCINHTLKRLYGGSRYVRYKPLGYLLSEIKSVLEKYRFQSIEFYDEIFTLDKNRVINFCNKYSKEIALPFTVNTRANSIDRETLQALKKAGCTKVLIGIESGDATIRRNYLNRLESDEQIVQAFSAARGLGLQTRSYNMVGLPFETERSVKKTIELNRRCMPDYISVSILNAYKDTEIYRLCEKEGWLNDEMGGLYFQSTNVRHPNFSRRELQKIRDRFGFEVFKYSKPVRAFVELIDKKMTKYPLYILLRSQLIRLGFKKLL